jgi:molecular chaperone GrpE (heat shock protein)
MDIVVRSTDLPQREEIAERIQQATGQGDPEKMEPEQRAAMAQQQEDAQQAEQMAVAEQSAKIKESEAKADKALAEAQRILAELQQVQQQMRHQEESHSLDMDMGMEQFAHHLLAPPGQQPQENR